MQIKHITADSFQTTNWSGGTTTELYIYPEATTYQERNFLFRLSKATIEQEETTFTPLAGVKRSLMVLEGALTLIHEGQAPKELDKFDIENFTGDWNTRSVGKATDLNLMCREDAVGLLKKRVLRKIRLRSFWQENSLQPYRAVLYYMHEGKAEIASEKQTYLLKQGEILVILPEAEEHIVRIHPLEKSVWVGAYIQ
jgi:environmental stress-induced protein Ves